MTPRTTPTKKRTDPTTDQDNTAVHGPSPAANRSLTSSRPSVRMAVWAVTAVALAAGAAVLVDSDGGPSSSTETSAPDVATFDAVVGREIVLNDLRSVGRVDPEAGRAIFVEDLRSIGRADAEVWRGAYVEDLRSVGRIDAEAGRAIFVEDLRSVGRVDTDAWRDIYVDDLRSVGRVTP